jgi:Xaa-Pro aminopeptidase
MSNAITYRFQRAFAWTEFAERRRRVFEAIGEGACAILQGAGPVSQYILFRQTNEFFYLTGIATPQAYVLLNGTDGTTTLFLPERPEGRSPDDGMLMAQDAETITAITGMERVLPLSQLASSLRGVKTVYTPFMPSESALECRDVRLIAAQLAASDPWDAHPTREQHFLTHLMTRLYRAEVRNLSPILDEFRLIKSPAEIEWMRRAGKLSAQVVTEAMKATRPGLRENHLYAITRFIYMAEGAFEEAYRAIIPAGTKNIWDIHYPYNDEPLRDGELVLMDTAPDCAYLTSDIGRVWAINGQFTPAQKQLYSFILAYHEEVLSRIQPGHTAEEITAGATQAMAPHVEKTDWVSPAIAEGAHKMLLFRGHLSHPVGMAVHDVGNYWKEPLRPGMVFSVDPQFWATPEQIYLRVEDTVLVTESGIEVLTGSAPRSIEALQQIVGSGSVFDFALALYQD